MEYKEIVLRMKKLLLIRRIMHQKSTVDFPLYPGQLHLLEYIKLNPGCTQANVADHLMITPASVALSTKRMEKTGLLTKQVDAGNLRCKQLFITQKGEEYSQRCREIFDEMDTVMFEGFTEDELIQLCSYLDKLLKNLSTKYTYNTEELDFFSMFAMRNQLKQNRRKDLMND